MPEADIFDRLDHLSILCNSDGGWQMVSLNFLSLKFEASILSRLYHQLNQLSLVGTCHGAVVGDIELTFKLVCSVKELFVE